AEKKKSADNQESGKKAGMSEKETEKHEKKAEQAGEAVQQAAAEIKSRQKKEEKADAPVEVTTIVHERLSPALIGGEGKKGYDIFIVGLDETSKQSNEFGHGVTNLTKGFDGPLVISAVRSDLQQKPDGKLSILVPVNGTEPSRRAA